MAIKQGAGKTPASVAQKATVKGALRLNEIAVIGIFGPEQAPEALIRMPGGKITRVKRGARLNRGRVAGIDANGVILQTGSQTRRLALP